MMKIRRNDRVKIKKEFIESCRRTEFNTEDTWVVKQITSTGGMYFTAGIYNLRTNEYAEVYN